MVVATDTDNFWASARAKLNLSVNQLHELPGEQNLLVVLNLIEFVHEHVAYPILGERHPYYGHRHLDFDGTKGKTRSVQTSMICLRDIALRTSCEKKGTSSDLRLTRFRRSSWTQSSAPGTILSMIC